MTACDGEKQHVWLQMSGCRLQNHWSVFSCYQCAKGRQCDDHTRRRGDEKKKAHSGSSTMMGSVFRQSGTAGGSFSRRLNGEHPERRMDGESDKDRSLLESRSRVWWEWCCSQSKVTVNTSLHRNTVMCRISQFTEDIVPVVLAERKCVLSILALWQYVYI